MEHVSKLHDSRVNGYFVDYYIFTRCGELFFYSIGNYFNIVFVLYYCLVDDFYDIYIFVS